MIKTGSRIVIRATAWSALGVYTNRFLALGIAAILSRLLAPEDFGTIAMVTVLSGFMAIFADAGIGSAVVQFRDFKSRDHQVLFFLSILLGLGLAGILVLSSSLVANFFKNPDLELVAKVMALAFPCSTLGIVPLGLLQRDMRFREIAIVNISAALISGCVGVMMAFAGWGYWALVAQALTNSFLSSCSFLVLARLSPVPCCDYSVIQKIICYSGNVTLFSMVNYWARNLDNLLIGKFLGSSSLGFYSRAYQLMMLPIAMLTSVITPVLHSALSEKQDDIPAMYRAYKKTVHVIALVSIPGMSFAVVMAPELVRVVWGDQWGQTIPLFAILGINGLFQPIMSTTGIVFLARNKAHLMFRCGLISTFLYCFGIICGLSRGAVGVAVGYTIASNLFFLPLMFFVFVKLLNGSFVDFLRVIRFPFCFSFIYFPVVYWYSGIVRSCFSDMQALLLVFICSCCAYFSALFVFEREYFRSSVKLIAFKFLR